MTKAEKRQAELRDIMIASGVRNLREFGYLGADQQNILTEAIYKAFFIRQLEEWAYEREGDVKRAAESLLRELDA